MKLRSKPVSLNISAYLNLRKQPCAKINTRDINRCPNARNQIRSKMSTNKVQYIIIFMQYYLLISNCFTMSIPSHENHCSIFNQSGVDNFFKFRGNLISQILAKTAKISSLKVSCALETKIVFVVRGISRCITKNYFPPKFCYICSSGVAFMNCIQCVFENLEFVMARFLQHIACFLS